MMNMIKRIGEAGSAIIAAVRATGTTRWSLNTWTAQIRAARSPWSSCFSHCSAWFLANCNVKATADEITAELNDGLWNEWVERNIGRGMSAQYAGRMQTLWQLQEAYLNRRLVSTAHRAVFSLRSPDEDLKYWLQFGPVIIGTSPEYQGQTLGHIMLVTGRDPAGWWYIDDPFGDFRNGYARAEHNDGDDLRVGAADLARVRGQLSIHAEPK